MPRLRSSLSWVLSSLVLAALAGGCAHRRDQANTYPTETVVETTVEIPGQAIYVAEPATQASVAAVAEAPAAPAVMVPYDDQSYIEETYALDPVADNPDLLGYETTSAGQQLEVYVYVVNVVQPIEAYPRVWWSGRWYYNIDGYLVFYSPTFSRWCYYYAPPVGLAYAWNVYYPAQPYRWAHGYHGAGWYWGGATAQGHHAYARNPHPGGPSQRPAHAGGPTQRPGHPGGPTSRPSRPGGPGRPHQSPDHAGAFAAPKGKPPVTPPHGGAGRPAHAKTMAPRPLPRPGATGTITTSTGRTYPTPGAHGSRPTVSNRVVPPTRPSRPVSSFGADPGARPRPHATGGDRVAPRPAGPTRPAPQSRPTVSRPSTPPGHRPMVSRPSTPPPSRPSATRAPSPRPTVSRPSAPRPSAPTRAPSSRPSSPNRAAPASRPSAPRPSGGSRSMGGGRRGR